MISIIPLCVIAFCSVQIFGATPAQWRRQSIYQVLTDRYARTDNNHLAKCNTTERVYCGGTWHGLMNNLDYIQDLGFTAVWISPITHNTEERAVWGEAYHGYWQDDLNRLNGHFGTESDLKALSTELHRRGMYLMVDIVINHFVTPGPGSVTRYSQIQPFNHMSFFHPFCTVSDYDNQDMIERCWLGDSHVRLADVNTEDPRVIGTYNTWINSLISNYSIDGLRIDTAKHVQKTFWPAFVKAAGVFASGEILSRDFEYTCDYQNYFDSVINYPIWYPLINAFSSSNTSNISELAQMHRTLQTGCRDPTLLLTFLGNHDTTRFAATIPSLALRKNALAYAMLADGIPTLYQGDEQGFAGPTNDPDNREALWTSGFDKSAPLYQMIQKLNKLRAWAGQNDTDHWISRTTVFWTEDNYMAFRRGSSKSQIVSILTNNGGNSTTPEVKVERSGFAPGTILMDIVACKEVAVGQDGVLRVTMADGNPKVLFPVALLGSSGICASRSSQPLTPVFRKMYPRLYPGSQNTCHGICCNAVADTGKYEL
ncbi:putative alpha-amylase a type-1 2 protein [Venturia nashicola]|nr:putative alpha-amylase a type-1 2 protein [Venturia nashicola]